MEKKLYMSPLIEVDNIALGGIIMESPVVPVTPITPPGPSGAPKSGDLPY